MSLLFKNLRVHQIFGANTDVGKTILTTALVRGSAANNTDVHYLKPVSTGPPEDADDGHIKRYTSTFKERVFTECLYRYQDPVSPHLAVKMANADVSKKLNNQNNVPSNSTFVNAIASHVRDCAFRSRGYSNMYVETAGGVHSPTLSGITQVEAYRPLFLPTILIGDSKLGGISTTISAYETLVLRGFIVDSILLFRDNYYRNWEYLKEYFADREVLVSSVEPPPDRLADPTANHSSTNHYYDSLLSSVEITEILQRLDTCHQRRIEELQSMPRRTMDTIWWPFVQHGTIKEEKDVTVIDSAYSDFFSVAASHNDSATQNQTSLLQPQLDGSASWWTQTFGHTNTALTLAAARAAGRYGHVMFPKASHLPALKLAENLVHEGPGKGWASRAFFSDDGSTGMEIALKMALRAFSKKSSNTLSREDQKSLGVLGLKGSYHGDTIGAMDACEEGDGVYTCEWHNARGFWLDPPSISIREGKVWVRIPPTSSDKGPSMVEMKSLSWTYDVQSRLNSPLYTQYIQYITHVLAKIERQGLKLGALVLEPLVLGAGGMVFVDPLFQRALIDVVRGNDAGASSSWSGLPVIFDEVFVGLYRLGVETTSSILGVTPDISVHAKILTGGLVPLAATLASKSIFEAFYSENKADALLHGHSYTAHAIGCEVANETLRLIKQVAESSTHLQAKENWDMFDWNKRLQQGEQNPQSGTSSVWSLWHPDFLSTVSKLPSVEEAMALGTVLAIKLKDSQGGYTSNSAESVFRPILSVNNTDKLTTSPGGAPYGVHFRTLGNVAYFMTSLNTDLHTVGELEDKIFEILGIEGARPKS